jgi:type IV secretion system protein VirB2
MEIYHDECEACFRRAAPPAALWVLPLPSRSPLAGAASASGTGMPWETPLNNILESVQGPVAKIIAVIVIITTGLSLAFGETAGGFRRLIQIVFGLSIAFAASSFFLSFFSFGGGALVA